jgi:hypothetical protein
MKDFMYQIIVRQAIESGLKNSDMGKTIDVKECMCGQGLGYP